MSIYLSFFDIFEVYVDRIDNFVNYVAKPQIPGKPKNRCSDGLAFQAGARLQSQRRRHNPQALISPAPG